MQKKVMLLSPIIALILTYLINFAAITTIGTTFNGINGIAIYFILVGAIAYGWDSLNKKQSK